MLTFSKLENKGHLGNQLFQIASTIGLAKKHNQDFGFKPWKYAEYFKNPLPEVQAHNFELIQESSFEYHDWQLKNKHYDIEGWLQTEQYFDINLTKHYFIFKQNLIDSIKNKYKLAFEKETILFSIRRGDFVNHPDYYQTPIQYFLNAFDAHFSTINDYNFIVLSDNLAYCKYHFGCLPNAFFGDGLNAVEQLCLGSLCNHFIISNSTFSWWSAWLGEKPSSKIITPIKNFRGKKAKELNDKDYFPKRWLSFDYTKHSIKFNADVFCYANNFKRDILNKYYSFYFNIHNFKRLSKSDILKANQKGIAIHNIEGILPPFSIYYSYLKAGKNQQNVRLFYQKKIVVNYQLSYKEFDKYQDFGVYTSVFKTSTSKEKKALKVIVPKSKDIDGQLTVPIIGTFSSYGGFGYFLKQKQRQYLSFTKKFIKKLIKLNRK